MRGTGEPPGTFVYSAYDRAPRPTRRLPARLRSHFSPSITVRVPTNSTSPVFERDPTPVGRDRPRGETD